MAEQIRRDDKPKILDVVEDSDGRYHLDLRGAKARDIFATLRFHEPDEKSARNHISFLFGKAVEMGMLRNTTVNIHDPAANEEIEGVVFKRTMKFSGEVTPEQARKAFLAAYRHSEEEVHEIEERVLGAYIDAGYMPISGVVFRSRNEIVAAQPDAIAAELSKLTERHYGGQDLGGPANGN